MPTFWFSRSRKPRRPIEEVVFITPTRRLGDPIPAVKYYYPDDCDFEDAAKSARRVHAASGRKITVHHHNPPSRYDPGACDSRCFTTGE